MALSVDHNICVLQRQNELNAVSGSTSNRFEQFISDPLLFLSKLYSAATSQATRTPTVELDHVSLTKRLEGSGDIVRTPARLIAMLETSCVAQYVLATLYPVACTRSAVPWKL